MASYPGRSQEGGAFEREHAAPDKPTNDTTISDLISGLVDDAQQLVHREACDLQETLASHGFFLGSCRFRGVGHHGIAFAAPCPVIGLRLAVGHAAVSAQHTA